MVTQVGDGNVKGFPEQRANITLEMDNRGNVLLREIYTCTNPSCPDATHEDIARTPVEAAKILRKWLEQLLISAEPEGRG